METTYKWKHSRCVNFLLPIECDDKVIELLSVPSASKGITTQTEADRDMANQICGDCLNFKEKKNS